MAIPATPQNFYAQTGNLTNYLSWDLAAGATSYSVYRSLDGVTYSSLATPAVNHYLDDAVTQGIQYFYKVASVNASGTSAYTAPQSLVPAPTSEMSLGALRLASQQKADRVDSDFVTVPEWNTFINLAMYELYDLLITVYEDYFMAPRVRFQSDGSSFMYALPNGVLSFAGVDGNTFVAQPFYKLLGVDLAINTGPNNAFVTIKKYNLVDRNRFIYPNTASTIYGVFNLRYRLLGTNIEFIPTPSAGQTIQLLYIPRLPQLLQDTDITTLGFSGWLNYVIVRAAKYALDKEESDTSKLDAELAYIKGRVEETAPNRDAGMPDTISDVTGGSPWGFNGPFDGFKGGF